ncbi:MAG: hypothetical protein H6585_09595 [Flavobacteriales bacterium]|nr:hypothetical protein [Flavobacteriales bacterium]MCB9448583.1 hypothetical protein [Flavobacteriales bacterium]
MKSIAKRIICATGFLFLSIAGYSQCDSTATICSKHISNGFISDGQIYRALLLDKEVAEFHATFYGGSTYRIAACTGLEGKDLEFSVYDPQHNLLFTNSEFEDSPYWDFVFDYTVNCTIEAKLGHNNSAASGCAVMLIGFKQ